MFQHSYRYLFITLLALYAFLNTVLCNVYHYFNIEISWYLAMLTIGLITFLTWEGNRLLEPVIRKQFLTPRTKIRFLAAFFIAGNVIAAIASLVSVLLVGALILQYDRAALINPLKLNIIYGTLINLFFHLLNSIFFFFREYRHHWAEAEELRRISAQAQVQLVKSQVHPHFLFNNLNVLSGMVIKDNPEANRFIEEFSKVYRYILNNQQKELVDLRSELDFVQPYIFLLQKRFDNGLQVEIDVPEKYHSWQLVPAALQMLIENAIKHNVVSRNKPLHISIHANGDEMITVTNNLQPRWVSEPSSKIGLENIRKRYELISGKDVIVRNTGTHFEVSLPLLNLN